MSVLDLPHRTGVPTGASVMDGRTRCRIGYVLVACGLALLPWLVVLATGFPAIVGTAQESLTWVGLDSLEAVGLVTTGLLVLWCDPRSVLAASATAVLLLADAWFDTTTAASSGDFVSALAMAVGAELPLAALCAVLTIRGFDVLRERGTAARVLITSSHRPLWYPGVTPELAPGCDVPFPSRALASPRPEPTRPVFARSAHAPAHRHRPHRRALPHLRP